MSIDTAQRSMARSSLLTAAGAAVSAAAGFVFTVVAGRTLGPDGAGVVFALTSLFMITTTVLKLGTDTTLVRTSARLHAAGRPGQVRAVLRVLTWPVALVTVVTAVLAGLAAEWVASTSLEAPAQAGTAVVVALAILVPAQTLTVTLLAMLRGLGDLRPLVLIDQIGKPVLRVVLALVAALLLPTVLGIGLAWALPVAVGFLATVLLTVLHLRRLPSPDGGGTEDATTDDATRPTPGDPGMGDAGTDDTSARELWRYSGPRAVAQAVEIVTLMVGVVLVARLAGPTEAGLYAAVNRLALAGMLTWQAARLVVAPQQAALLAADRRADVQALHLRSTAWITMAAWPFYLGLIGLAPQVLGLFGPGFADGAAALVVVGLAMLVPTLVGPAQTIALMAGWSTAGLVVSVVTLMVSVGLTASLAAAYGALGGAIGWSAGVVVEAVLYASLVRRRLGFSPVGSPPTLVAAVALGTVGSALLLAHVLHTGPWGDLGLLAAGSAGYLAVLIGLRDKTGLSDLLRFRGARRQDDQSDDQSKDTAHAAS